MHGASSSIPGHGEQEKAAPLSLATNNPHVLAAFQINSKLQALAAGSGCG